MLSPRSRREAIEQGKAELNKLYAQLPEGSYDLSLRDLVEEDHTRRLSFSGGLPLEQRAAHEACSNSPPPDLTVTGFNTSSSAPSSPARLVSHFTTYSSTPPPPLRRPPQVSPRKVSPRPTPPVSPRKLWSTKEQVRPIFPVLTGFNIRCSSCSAHVIFFKTRCLGCSRVYCNRCLKSAVCRSKCGRGCSTGGLQHVQTDQHHSPTTKRSLGCWSFLQTHRHHRQPSSPDST